MVVLATRYGGNIEPVSLEVSEGETGIPIFETVEDAKEFDQGYREVLGRAWRHGSCQIRRWRSSSLGSSQRRPST